MSRHSRVWYLTCAFITGLLVWCLTLDHSIWSMLVTHSNVKAREATVSHYWDFDTLASCPVDPQDQHNHLRLRGFLQNLNTYIPFPDGFDRRYKSPCWHSNIEILGLKKGQNRSQLTMMKAEALKKSTHQGPLLSLTCLPQVYFIGFPKSGTTQLFQMLTKHPDIKPGHGKEPHWWTRSNHPFDYPYSAADIMTYLQYYKLSSDNIMRVQNGSKTLLVDASQSTVWDTKQTKNFCFLPQLFANLLPAAKFIVLMREPAERLYSGFKYFYSQSWKRSKFKSMPAELETNLTTIFHKKVMEQIHLMEVCLQTSSLDVCSHRDVVNSYYRYDHEGRPAGRVRLAVSLYHVHIRRWLNELPREQFLFLRMDELASNPLQMLREVWQFLGVREQSEEELTDVLYSHMRSNSVGSSTGMAKETAEILRRFFQPHNEALAELLGDKRFKWSHPML